MINKDSNGFALTYSSDSRYEEMTIEISYKNYVLCQINKDKGIDAMEIEFNPVGFPLGEEETIIKFPLTAFLEVVLKAKESLM